MAGATNLAKPKAYLYSSKHLHNAYLSSQLCETELWDVGQGHNVSIFEDTAVWYRVIIICKYFTQALYVWGQGDRYGCSKTEKMPCGIKLQHVSHSHESRNKWATETK